MPSVRATCPNCEVVTVAAVAVTVRRRSDVSQTECTFVCPACAAEVIHPVPDRMVETLIGAGCAVEKVVDKAVDKAVEMSGHPSVSPVELTEAEIEAFARALGRDDWFDELAP